MNSDLLENTVVVNPLLTTESVTLANHKNPWSWDVLNRCRLWVHRAVLATICMLSIGLIYYFTSTYYGLSGLQAKTLTCQHILIPDEFWKLDENSPAFVHIPSSHDITQEGSVCIRVIVPSQRHNHTMTFTPFPNMPWDSILLDFVGQETGISVSVDLQMADNKQNYLPYQAHVYEADVLFRDADTFVPSGYIEYRNAEWNSEDHVFPQPMIPEPLLIPANTQVSVASNNTSIYNLQNYLNLPLCTAPNEAGRWVDVNHLPFNASLVPSPDTHNRVWLPYACRLLPHTYNDLAQCLEKKHPLVHWFGDSNTRRALKKITTMGSWCSDPSEVNNIFCKCSDNAEIFSGYNTLSAVTPIHLTNGSQITLFKWGGLTALNNPPWADTFTPDFQQNMGSPSVAIFGLLNWDVAYSSRTFFAQEVGKLIDLIEQNYPASTDIIIRTGQYYCCTHDHDAYWKRKFSRLRTEYFNTYIVDAFEDRFATQRKISIWDVAQISKDRPYLFREEQTKSCAPNHVSSDIIDTENQVLINHLCN